MKLLHECLVRSAREYPGNIAVVDQAGSCSYAELDARAEAYAGLLVALGVGRGERILLWAEKSVELPALMQGALRQGVVYVPVDPLGPVSRLEKILADSGASLVFPPRVVWRIWTLWNGARVSWSWTIPHAPCTGLMSSYPPAHPPRRK